MKRSKYYRTMMILFVIGAIGGTALVYGSYYQESAIVYTIAGICWLAVANALKHEKYKQ